MVDKHTLRSRLIALRKLRHEERPDDAAAALAQCFINAMPDIFTCAPPRRIIAAYLPVGSEIDPRALMHALAAQGHTLCLPVCGPSPAPMEFRQYVFGDALTRDARGMAAPAPTAEICRPDIILLPLLGFDGHGNRLGRGAGYYDFTLQALRRTGRVAAFGLAYHMQKVDKCPTEPHDQAIHGVATEQAMLLFD